MREKFMKSIAVNGGSYHYASWHSASLQQTPTPNLLPLLLVHGITASHMAWPRFVRSLGGARHLLAPDLRGRGKNAVLSEPFGFPQHVEDILKVMDAEGLERAIWVGHSLGAYLGLDFARAHPDRLAALILVDGGIALPLREGKTPKEVIKAILGPALARLELTYPSRESYHEFWRTHPAFQDPDAWNDDMLAYADYDLTGTPPLMRSVVNSKAIEVDSYYPMAPEMVSRIDEVTCPTLLLTAPRGLLNQAKPLLPKEAVSNAVQRNAHVEAAEILNTNHYSILTGSGASSVAKAVRGFLQQHNI
jgi:lipase